MAIFNKETTSAGEPLSPLSQKHRERQDLFRKYWNYYRGRHHKALKVMQGQSDDNVTLNYSRRVINKSLSFLFGHAVEFEIEGSDERTPPEEYLDTAWGTAEQKTRTLLDIGLNGAVTGTSFVRIYPPAETGDLPRIAALNPELMDIITNEDDIDDIRGYTMTWKAGEGRDAEWRRQRFDLQQNGTWVITQEVYSKASIWQLVAEERWPWQFAPVLYCQNQPNPNEVWGISDLEDADVNDAINWVMSNANRIIRYHAHPKTIGIGFSAAHLETTAIDQFWTINTPGAEVFNLEMQSDLASTFQFAKDLKTTYAQITGVPDLDPQQVNVGALSGFALKILYGDLLDLTNVKRTTYGALLAGINAALLEMAGFGQAIQVNNIWEDPLPANPVEEVQALTADRNAGLSTETYLERRGYDAEREMERAQDEQDASATLGETLLRNFETGAIAQPRQNGATRAESGR